MEQYAVTDGAHRHEFFRGTPAAAFAQARGMLVVDPRLHSNQAELQVWSGDTWLSLGLVTQLPDQATFLPEQAQSHAPAHAPIPA